MPATRASSRADRTGDARSLALTVAYDGAPFAGFARQPGQRTVQGELEEALCDRAAARRSRRSAPGGPTRASTRSGRSSASLRRRRARRPSRCCARSTRWRARASSCARCGCARPGFSARFDAVVAGVPLPASSPGRCRRCSSARSRGGSSSRSTSTRCARRPRTSSASTTSGRSASTESAEGKRTVRRDRRRSRSPRRSIWASGASTVRVVGNAFLHSMVRTIVGTLVEVGVGRRDAGVGRRGARRARPRARPVRPRPRTGSRSGRSTYPDDVWLVSRMRRVGAEAWTHPAACAR